VKKGRNNELLEESTPPRDLIIRKRRHPKALSDDLRLDLKVVLRARFKQSKQALDNTRSSMMALKVDERLVGVERWGLDDGGFLRVVDEIAGVYA